MLGYPKNSASLVTVVAGDRAVVVARCVSLTGDLRLRSGHQLHRGARADPKPESFPMKLAIEYAPMVSIVGYDNNWYVGRTNVELICQAKGNPIPTTVAWRTENKLKVLKVDETVNTTFVCEVRNRLGPGKDQLTVYVRDPPAVPSNGGVVAGVVIGTLLALLLVGALVAILVMHHRGQQQQASKNGAGPGNGPSNNNGPMYTYREGLPEGGLGGKANQGPGGVALLSTTPTAQDILLSSEMDEAERRKFDSLEEDEEEGPYTHLGPAPILQLQHHHGDHPHVTHLPPEYLGR
ncbi:hypothetical protein ACEWY4_027825 [Coilia grayii]|uniref:Ig-like domain-containing protein n=1 Tax=Coilia grayii TaxID=363190 RepID=A0ABD1IST9_9TELE